MNNKCICHAMKRLQKEQKIIAGDDIKFQFICKQKEVDTIPFMLFSKELKKPFKAVGKCNATPFFRLEKIDEESCCAVLTLLEAVDMDGNPAEPNDLYALRKTKRCVIVNLNCFCVIQPFAPDLVNRPLPIIEPK
ncbi:CotY/CotZ family spore coat protein [Sporosarcina ureilytica]|uniref:Spore coat protein n=1 Tax=Sporosarcina ureilytica TaxID=298596 RepID=A0A1D8JGZ7_9BACL|nr:CotY/CotZ family spore coat protein [Sporosarcina ureilytica]AOV07954.1 hypothetical protein BI350_10670 [Sporosarcina ureilytica]